jgi:hypothetical protein
MKGERKLSLVRPPAAQEPASAGSDAADEALLPPVSAGEAEAARLLAEQLERGQDPVLGALVAAYRPAALDDAAHEAILSRALRGSHEPSRSDAPPSSSEQAAAEGLRRLLDERDPGPGPHGPAAEMAIALRSAYRPREIAPLQNEALIARAARVLGRARSRPARRILPVTMAALTGVAALAAGVALLVLRPHAAELTATAPSGASAAHTPMSRSRSTIDLFDPVTPFARTGGQSARIDRIASARAAELRENRFVAWGVQ